MNDLSIRAMCHRDMRHVQDIASLCFPTPPRNDNEFRLAMYEFRLAMYERDYHAVVAEQLGGMDRRDEILGYLLYRVHRFSLQILNFAVAPKAQRKGVGTELWNRLLRRLTPDRRPEVWADVDAENVDAQLFLRSRGARAFQIVPGEPEQYRFSWRLNGHRAFIGTCDTRMEEIEAVVV